MLRTLTATQKDLIVALYTQGRSALRIDAELEITRGTSYRLLCSYGLQRSCGEAQRLRRAAEPEPQCGTLARYRRGWCHCERCRAANAAYKRGYLERRRDLGEESFLDEGET